MKPCGWEGSLCAVTAASLCLHAVTCQCDLFVLYTYFKKYTPCPPCYMIVFHTSGGSIGRGGGGRSVAFDHLHDLDWPATIIVMNVRYLQYM